MTSGIRRERFTRVLDSLRWLLVLLPLVSVAPDLTLWTWLVAGVALIASLPMLWLPARPSWLLATSLLVVAATTGTLFTLHPSSLIAAAVFTTLFYATRFLSAPLATAVGALVAGSIIALIAVHHVQLGEALLNISMIALFTLLGLNRRGRAQRLEQTELALARARTATEEHAVAAALAERTRIARELHDVLAHSLSGLSLNLQSIRLMLVRDGASPDTLAQVERAQRLTADGVAEARRAVTALRDDPVPLEQAINDLLTGYRLDTHAAAELEIHGTSRVLDTATATTVLRVVQEALSNTRKHAPGADVRARLTFAPEELEIRVQDHQDAPPPASGDGGYGLRGMRERAELLGGRLSTGPGENGWQVQLTVPA